MNNTIYNSWVDDQLSVWERHNGTWYVLDEEGEFTEVELESVQQNLRVVKTKEEKLCNT